MELAVFAAAIVSVQAQETAPVELGCTRTPQESYSKSRCTQKMAEYQSAINSTQAEMRLKQECIDDALSRLRDASNNPSATIEQYLIPDSQTNAYKGVHDAEARMEKLIRFDVPHAEDDYRN